MPLSFKTVLARSDRLRKSKSSKFQAAPTAGSTGLCHLNVFRRFQIADYLGLTIETVSRTLTRFEREKLLTIVPGGVRLADSTRAEAVAAA